MSKKNKRTFVAVLCVILVAAFAIGGSIAYLNDEDEAVNRFVVGDIDVDLTEDEWNPDPDPYPIPDPENPGTEIPPRKSWDVNSTFKEGDKVKTGDQIIYRIEYYNHHDTEMTVRIVDELDAHVKFVKAGNGGIYDDTAHTISWVLRAKAHTVGKVTLTVEVLDSAADKVENSGSVQIGNDNTIEVGPVENEIDPDRVIPPGEGGDLMPGAVKIKDPLVTAVKGDMYFRLKVSMYEMEEDGSLGNIIQDPDQLDLIVQTLYFDTGYPDAPNLSLGLPYSLARLTELEAREAIYGLGSHPVFTLDSSRAKVGEYYYNYTGNGGILEEGDRVYFLTNVVIPEDWTADQLEILGSYAVSFKVQAIQADHFNNAKEAFDELAAVFGE